MPDRRDADWGTMSRMTDALYRAIARYSGWAIRHRSARTPSAITSAGTRRAPTCTLCRRRERDRLAAFARNAWWKRVTSHLLHFLPPVSAFCRLPLLCLERNAMARGESRAPYTRPAAAAWHVAPRTIKRGQLFTKGGNVFSSGDPSLPAVGVLALSRAYV